MSGGFPALGQGTAGDFTSPASHQGAAGPQRTPQTSEDMNGFDVELMADLVAEDTFELRPLQARSSCACRAELAGALARAWGTMAPTAEKCCFPVCNCSNRRWRSVRG